MDSAMLNQPLLQDAEAQTPVITTPLPPIDKPIATTPPAYSRTRIACFMVSALVAMFLLVTLAYLAETGAFSKIDRDVRIVNGTVMEPNTHAIFPLQRPTTLLGQPGPERLAGVLLEAVTKAHVSIKIFTMAFYVDRTEARKVLAKYRKSGVPDAKKDPVEFAEFIDVMSRGDFTFMVENRMLLTTPGTQFQDGLADAVEVFWKQTNSAAEVKEMRSCLLAWFGGKQMHNGETYMYEYSTKTHAMRKSVNGKLAPNECKMPGFAQGYMKMQLTQYGNTFVNLMETLWNQEYDNP